MRSEPFQPETPVVHQGWARYHDLITAMEHMAGDLLNELEDDDVGAGLS